MDDETQGGSERERLSGCDYNGLGLWSRSRLAKCRAEEIR